MSNAQFVRGSSLPPGWIDLGIGEARLIRRALENTLGVDFLLRSEDAELDYQPAQGNPSLIREVEAMHRAPCVVTIGAKQGVYAALAVAKRKGCKRVGMRDPAWPPLVLAAQTLGFEVTFCEPTEGNFDCFLLVSPNNPDGFTHTPAELALIEAKLKASGKFLIHDAAYFCKPYMHAPLPPIGDVQVVSVSKRFGLSGLRVGWAIARSEDIVHELQDVVETVTAGVCGTAQGAVAKLLRRLRLNPRVACLFEDECATAYAQARSAALTFNPDVLRVDGLPQGAFAWCEKGPKYDVEKLMVQLVDGTAYGHPERVRVNLVGDVEDVRELAYRTHQF